YLTAEEWAFALEATAPKVRFGRGEDGDVVLVVTYYGGTTEFGGWDGSVEDAEAIVDEHAETAAMNVSDGYWQTGGWRTHTTFE
ncbi:MAG: hypothetical protein ACRDZW_02815, partial [Acidimicrobiales bacterium]